MPATFFKGIGTMYWGSKNDHSVMGTCESCGQFVALRSSDTCLYIVVLYLPVIPLGKKRILNSCPRCTRHKVMPLKDWEAAKQIDRERALEALRTSPGEPAPIIAALRMVIAYHDEEGFDLVAQKCGSALDASAEGLRVLGGAYGFFSHPDEAEKAYRSSLALKDDIELRENFADFLIRRGKPQDAKPLLDHILSNGEEEKFAHLTLLVKGFQAEWLHREALDLVKDCESVFPRSAADREFQGLKQTSIRLSGTSRPVAGNRPVETGPRKPPFFSTIGGKVAAAVFLLGWVGLYLGVAVVKGRSRAIWLVDGLPIRYEARVNGKLVTLVPGAPSQIDVCEGEVSVKVLDARLEIPERTCRIESNFFTRPFTSPTFVLNPDRMAFLVWEKTIYAVGASGQSLGDDSYRVNYGSLLAEYHVDYPFQEFPKTLTLDSHSRSEIRERVYQWSDLTPSQALKLVGDQAGKGAVTPFVMGQLRADPESEFYLEILAAIATPEEFTAFLKPRLTARPPLIEVHRTYQGYAERALPHLDIEKEYRDYLEQAPDDKALQYLLARMLIDPAESEKLYAQAGTEPSPCAYAVYALGYRRVSQARFEDALPLAERAIALDRQKVPFRNLRGECLLALGRYDELLRENTERQQHIGAGGELVAEEMRLRTRKGEKGPIPSAQRYVARLAQGGRMDEAKEWLAYLTAVHAYSEGNAVAFAEKIALLEGEGHQFQAQVALGKWSEAAKILKEGEGFGAYQHLLVYIGAEEAGDDGLADAELLAAVQDMRNNGADERIVAECMFDRQPTDLERVTATGIPPLDMRVLVTAMGVRFPGHRAVYFDLARKLDYDSVFPHLTLKAVLEK